MVEADRRAYRITLELKRNDLAGGQTRLVSGHAGMVGVRSGARLSGAPEAKALRWTVVIGPIPGSVELPAHFRE